MSQEDSELSSNIEQFDRKLVDGYSDVPRGGNWDMEASQGAAAVTLVVPDNETPFIQWTHARPVQMRLAADDLPYRGTGGSAEGVRRWRCLARCAVVHEPAARACELRLGGCAAKLWRVEFQPNPGVVLTGVRLWQGYRIADYTGKAMFDPYGLDCPLFTDVESLRPDSLSGCVIPRDGIVDLTGKMSPDGRLDWKAPPGRWTILRFRVRADGEPKRSRRPGRHGL